MAKRKAAPRRKQIVEVQKDCYFCKEKKIPDFLEYELLSRFTSERGKILSRSRTGVCAKHQRRITREVKRARYIAFLPFAVKAD